MTLYIMKDLLIHKYLQQNITIILHTIDLNAYYVDLI